MEIPLLKYIAIIFGLAVPVLFICHRIGLPAVVGFILTGVVVGPFGFGFVAHEAVDHIAEIGVVLLLFTIGLEFSFGKLARLKKAVFVGGILQVVLTTAATYLIMRYLDFSGNSALFIGFLIALSSTAIVLKIIQERGEVDTAHGRTKLAILILQDIIVVPMMLLTPYLTGTTNGDTPSPLWLLAKGALLVVLVVISARYIVPKMLYYVSRTRIRELFLIAICAISLLVGWVTSSLGLSLALGAFLAGLVISESEYSLKALSGIMPFRDVFTSLFFVSIGMLLSLDTLFSSPFLILLMAVSAVALKAFIVFVVAIILHLPLRSCVITALGLAQVGEFSFILARTDTQHALISTEVYSLFLAVSVVTMVATPFLIIYAPKLADIISRLPLSEKMQQEFARIPVVSADMNRDKLMDHLIVVGYGINGRMVVSAAQRAHIPFVVIDLNPDTVRDERAKGIPIILGDSTYEAVLEHANIVMAKMLVVASSDPSSNRRTVYIAKQMNPSLYIITRTEYLGELNGMLEIGADEVVPKEYEAAVEITARMLVKYVSDESEIAAQIARLRTDSYASHRAPESSVSCIDKLKAYLPEFEIGSIVIRPGSGFEGARVSDLPLDDARVVAIRRNGAIIDGNPACVTAEAGDAIILVGSPDALETVAKRFVVMN